MFCLDIIILDVGKLDVDKLDYLYRDSFYFGAGTPFDLIRIISHAKVINKNICFPEKNGYSVTLTFYLINATQPTTVTVFLERNR